jgi:tetratricopeptide (TPR) repeat protein
LEWGGLIISLLAFLVSAFAYIRARRTDKRTERLEVKDLLDQAWDLMGGKVGTKEIENFTTDRTQLEVAKRCIDKALIIDPDCGHAYLRLGIYYFGIEQADKAVESLHRSARLAPLDADLAFLMLAQICRRNGDLKEAELWCRKAIELDSEFGGHHHQLGQILVKKGELQEAVRSFEHARKVGPPLPAIYLNLANALTQSGRAGEAIEHYEKAIELNPTAPVYRENYGVALRALGRLDGAVAAFQMALAIDPRYKLKAQSLELLGNSS